MKKIFHVRAATLGDLKAICATEWAASREKVLWGEVPASRDDLRARIGPLCFIAEAAGRVVGHAYGVPRRTARETVFRGAKRYLEIDAAYVLRAWRGQGVGTALVKRLVREGRNRGFRRFYVYTANKELEKAMRFYRKAGFRPWYATLFI